VIFETISWLAAHQSSAGNALLRDPHLSSTTQGLDGLMIELDHDNNSIKLATIFEDKCSEHPRDKFRDEIMTAFKAHHREQRASELLAAAAALLAEGELSGAGAVDAASRVLDRSFRAYRGSLAVTSACDSLTRRKSLFKDYEELDGIQPDRRIGAVLVTGDDLRAWFQEIADRAITYLDELESESS
jgi:hypothetical protein